MISARRQILGVVAIATIAAGCAAPPQGVAPAGPSATAALDFKTPALITFASYSGRLEYFVIRRGGSQKLHALSGALGITSGVALAADGDDVAIANYMPPEVVTYNVKTKAAAYLSDPYGSPNDIAIGKTGTIYAMNRASVAVFKSGSAPTELSCTDIVSSVAVAVNNEGDVFVDGYGSGSFAGVVEYPAGSTQCKVLHLLPSEGYLSGVGVDPKTDDLITMDAPDYCAGGYEARMTIYPKPYNARKATQVQLNATHCAGTFRLDASSTHIFYSDASVSSVRPIIDQARYPSGKSDGRYWEGYFF